MFCLVIPIYRGSGTGLFATSYGHVLAAEDSGESPGGGGIEHRGIHLPAQRSYRPEVVLS